MNNDLATMQGGQLTTPEEVTLLDMRVDSQRFPRVGSYGREEAVVEMSKIVSKAFLYRGNSADPTNIRFVSATLTDELLADLDHIGTRNISFAEIDRIVRKAVLTQDMFGVSVASLYRVIHDYIIGEGHRLDKEADKRRTDALVEEYERMFSPMMTSYAGAMVKNMKI